MKLPTFICLTISPIISYRKCLDQQYRISQPQSKSRNFILKGSCYMDGVNVRSYDNNLTHHSLFKKKNTLSNIIFLIFFFSPSKSKQVFKNT